MVTGVQTCALPICYDPVLHKIRFEPVNEQPEMSEKTEGKKENVKVKTEKVDKAEKKKSTRKLENRQKQQEKVKTVSKGKSNGIINRHD
jgi:hypothetical protein